MRAKQNAVHNLAVDDPTVNPPLHPLHLDNDRYLIPGVGPLTVVHVPRECAGRVCTVHNWTAHHMETWPMGWDEEWSMLLRQRPHGVWHPDPDERPFRNSRNPAALLHTGDGCCSALWRLGKVLR